MSKPNIFISYSHKDEEWKDLLCKHLAVLEGEGLFTAWDDRRIGAGEDWYAQIQEKLNSANVAVLLTANPRSEGLRRKKSSRNKN